MVRAYDRSEVPSVYDLANAPAVRDEPGFRQVVFRGVDHSRN
jgi:seryl-tRNA(Sec) selenium transferase